MSKEDQEWLEAAMKEYCVNEADRMEEIINGLKKMREGYPSNKEQLDHDKMMEDLEELIDLVELHPRNNLNLCIMGGMFELLSLGFSYPNDGVQRMALQIIASACSNNLPVQEFAAKSGAMNLIEKFCNEKNIKNKEATFSALSSFIRADNFQGKVKFIKEFNGLEFLASLLCDELANESIRLYRKVILLINDLILNDDGIDTNNPTLVRNFFATENNCME